MGCNASTNKFERGPQETDAKPINESKEINQEDNEINKESNENEKNKESNKKHKESYKKKNSFFSKKPDLDEEVTDERDECHIEETNVVGHQHTVPWFMNNGLVLGSSKSPSSEDNSRPGNGMERIRQPVDRNEFELYGILGAQAVLVEDTVARESRVPARDGPA